MWVNKNWTLTQVHHEVFKFFRDSLIGMFNITNKTPFKKQSIDENENGRPLTKDEFANLSLEE